VINSNRGGKSIGPLVPENFEFPENISPRKKKKIIVKI
jgi:hypothetical protein